MNTTLQKTALATLISVSLALTASAVATKPNILFVVADDLGWKDVGFHSSDLKTPNVEVGFKALLEQFHLPSAFPGEEFEFNQER